MRKRGDDRINATVTDDKERYVGTRFHLDKATPRHMPVFKFKRKRLCVLPVVTILLFSLPVTCSALILQLGMSSGSNESRTVSSGTDENYDNASYVGGLGTGTLTISGSGSSGTADGVFHIGLDSGSNGLLRLSTGATLTATSNDFIVGNVETAVGSVYISGAGTSATFSDLHIGLLSNQENRMIVSNSAVVTVGGDFLVADQSGSVAGFIVQSGALLDIDGSGTTALNVAFSGTGSLAVTGNDSHFKASGDHVVIGNDGGSNGLFTLSSGALLTHTSSHDFILGQSSSSIGSALITGVGTTALLNHVRVATDSENNNHLIVSDSATLTALQGMTAGKAGTAYSSVSIQSGAIVTLGAESYIGGFGSGTLTLTGSNSTLEVLNKFNLGQDSGSNGVMTISSGALLTATSDKFVLGNVVDSIGSMDITGTGTSAAFSDLRVGVLSNLENELSISNSAEISATNLYIGTFVGSNGEAIIENAAVVNTTNAFIGRQGTATLTVKDTNSQFSGTTIYIGSNVGGVGVLNIEVTGGVTSSGKIKIGGDGTGTLNLSISDGIASGDMELGGGTFNTKGNDQSGGKLGKLTLTADSVIDMGAGSSIINWTIADENTWTGTLKIYNWSGTKKIAGGTDQLIFNDITAWNKHAQVSFYSDSGLNVISHNGYFKSNGGLWELVPAPECSAYLGISSLLVFVVLFECRRTSLKLRTVSDRRRVRMLEACGRNR